LNPIEILFAQWKGFVRGKNVTNEEELFTAINNVDAVVTEENCRNYIEHVARLAYRVSIGDDPLSIEH